MTSSGKQPLYVAARVWAIQDVDEQSQTFNVAVRSWGFFKDRDGNVRKIMTELGHEKHFRESVSGWPAEFMGVIPELEIAGQLESIEREVKLLDNSKEYEGFVSEGEKPDTMFTVMLNYTVTGDSDYHMFPFDEQIFKWILVMRKEEDRDRFEFVVDEKLAVLSETIFHDGEITRSDSGTEINGKGPFEVKNGVKHNMLAYKYTSHMIRWVSKSAVEFKIRFKRNPNNMLLKDVLPCFLLGVFAFATLFIEASEFSSRAEAIIVLILTLVFQQQATVDGQLPQVSYLTLLDKYHIFVTLYLVLYIIEGVAVSETFYKSKSNADEAHAKGKLFMIAMWIVPHVVLLTFLIWHNLNTRKLIRNGGLMVGTLKLMMPSSVDKKS